MQLLDERRIGTHSVCCSDSAADTRTRLQAATAGIVRYEAGWHHQDSMKRTLHPGHKGGGPQRGDIRSDMHQRHAGRNPNGEHTCRLPYPYGILMHAECGLWRGLWVVPVDRRSPGPGYPVRHEYARNKSHRMKRTLQDDEDGSEIVEHTL